MRTRLVIVSLVFVLSVCCEAQNLSKSIQYTTSAVPLHKALEDISAKCKVRLIASQELENEPIVLRLQNVSLDDVKMHIASAMDAEWRKTNNGSYELWRSPELLNKIEQKLIDDRALIIGKAIKKKLAEVAKFGEFSQSRAQTLATQWAQIMTADANGRTNDDQSRRYALDQQFPDQRALWQIVSQVDPKLIASVKKGWRRTFSTNPSKTQGELPDSLLEAAPNWQEQHNLFSRELESALNGVQLREWGGDEGDARTPMPSMPRRLDLTVKVSQTNPQIDLSLLAFDEQNHPIAFIGSTLIDLDDDKIQQTEKAFEQADHSKAPTQNAAMSDATKAFMAFEKDYQTGGHEIAVSGALRQLVMHPENNEPLASFVSDALLGEAQLTGSNLAASPDDNFFGMAYVLPDNRFRAPVLGQTLTIFAPISGNRYEEKDGWIELSPLDPQTTLMNRVDRDALGKYVRAIDSKGYVALEDTAQYATSIKGHFFPSLTNLMMWMLFVPHDTSIGEDTLDLFKLYASLSDNQLQQMAQGTPIRIADLRSEQLEPLEDLVYQTQYTSTRGYTSGEHIPTPLETACLWEPTEQFPDGLPTNASILFRKTKDEDNYWVTIERMGGRNAQATDLYRLASLIAWSRELQLSPENQISIPAVALGHYREFTFEMKSGRDYDRTGVLQETVKTSKDMKLEDLPPDLKTKLGQMVDAYRKSMEQRPAPAQSNKPPAS